MAMDLDQLEQELMSLKSGNRERGFIDKYGSKFGNDTGIANLILAEMDRQGVDEASEAASEAVQSVLDKIREEATAVLDKTKGAMKEVSELMDKVNTMQEAIDGATGKAEGGEEPPVDAGMGGDLSAPPMDSAAAPPPDLGMGAEAGALPPDMGGGAVPPADAGSAMPPAAPTELPADAGPSAPPPMPDEGAGGEMAPPPAEDPMAIPSDVRLKNIKSKFAAYKQTRTATVPSDVNVKKVWKPSAGTLDAIRGLM